MDELQKQLQALGLTEEEIQVYIQALLNGSVTVLELSKNTSIPRTTVYLLVDSLLEKKLLRLSEKDKKKSYFPASPEELILIAEKKEQEYKQTAKQLKAKMHEFNSLYHHNLGEPKVLSYQGRKDVSSVFQSALDAEKVYMHFMSREGRELIGQEAEAFYEQLTKKMIPTMQIIRDTESNRTFKEQYETSRNKIRCLDETYATTVDYLLFGDSVAYFIYKNGEPIVTVVKDPDIAMFEKSRFSLVWNAVSAL